MDTEEIRRFVEDAAAAANEAFANPDLRERYVELYAEDVALEGYPPGLQGRDGARTFYMGFFEALDGGNVDLQEVLVEGETAAVRFRVTGTHAGELMGVPASGNAVDVTGQSFIRVRNGRIAERIQSLDTLTLLQQLGAIPLPA